MKNSSAAPSGALGRASIEGDCSLRVGITYLYTIFKYGYPHRIEDALQALRDVSALGFRFFEMEGLGPEMLHALNDRRGELLDAVRDAGVHVHNFCVVDPDLVSQDDAAQQRAIEGFRVGAELAVSLGTETLHLASYAPPVEYGERKPYQLGAEGGYSFGDRFEVRIPDEFDWNKAWGALVKSCRDCANIAAAYGKTVIMEPRVGEMICSVDSLLRLIEHVGCPNFKANFDTGHFSAQRENVVLALAKLRGNFANIHIADNDPVNVDHLPIGDGTIDWREFFRTLKRMNYQGYLGLDLGMTPTLVEDYRRSVEAIRSITSDLDIAVEV